MDPSIATGMVERAWVAESTVGHIMGAETKSEDVAEKALVGREKVHGKCRERISSWSLSETLLDISEAERLSAGGDSGLQDALSTEPLVLSRMDSGVSDTMRSLENRNSCGAIIGTARACWC